MSVYTIAFGIQHIKTGAGKSMHAVFIFHLFVLNQCILLAKQMK
jgi:hypothetical protein